MKRSAFFLAVALSACGLVDREPASFSDPAPRTPLPASGAPAVLGDVGSDPTLPPPRPPCGELHIVGIYESRSDHGGGMHPMGSTRVRFGRAGDNILVLSAYEPTHWNVELAPGAGLARVILSGYHDQVATVPAGIPVEIRSYEVRGNYLGASGYAWPSSEGGSNTPLLVHKVEELTSRRLTSFHGCYRMTDVEIRPDLSSTGDCPTAEGYRYSQHVDPGSCLLPDDGSGAGGDSGGTNEDEENRADAARRAVSFPGCAAVTRQSAYCLSTSYDQLYYLIGLDDGQVCKVADVRGQAGSHVHSLAWQSERVYECDGEATYQVALRGGPRVTALGTACEGAASYRRGLVLLPSFRTLPVFDTLFEAKTFDDIRKARLGTISPVRHSSSRLTVGGSEVFMAGHSTSGVQVFELPGGALRRTIPLTGYDDWINGMAPAGPGILAMLGVSRGSPTQPIINLYDRATGTLVRQVTLKSPSLSPQGLACVTGP